MLCWSWTLSESYQPETSKVVNFWNEIVVVIVVVNVVIIEIATSGLLAKIRPPPPVSIPYHWNRRELAAIMGDTWEKSTVHSRKEKTGKHDLLMFHTMPSISYFVRLCRAPTCIVDGFCWFISTIKLLSRILWWDPFSSIQIAETKTVPGAISLWRSAESL